MRGGSFFGEAEFRPALLAEKHKTLKGVVHYIDRLENACFCLCKDVKYGPRWRFAVLFLKGVLRLFSAVNEKPGRRPFHCLPGCGPVYDMLKMVDYFFASCFGSG